MSPSSGRRTCWIGLIHSSTCNPLLCASTRAHRSALVFHLPLPLLRRPYGRPVRYRSLFERFEKIMCAYDRRPHWANPGRIHLVVTAIEDGLPPLRSPVASSSRPCHDARHLPVLFPNITTPAWLVNGYRAPSAWRFPWNITCICCRIV